MLQRFNPSCNGLNANGSTTTWRQTIQRHSQLYHLYPLCRMTNIGVVLMSSDRSWDVFRTSIFFLILLSFFFFFREGWKTSLTFQSISIRIFLFWVTEWILKSPLDVKIIRLVSIRYCTWLQNDKMELAHFSSQLLKSVSMFDVNISKQFEDTFWHHAMGLAESFDPERSSSTIRTSWLVRYRRRCLKKNLKKMHIPKITMEHVKLSHLFSSICFFGGHFLNFFGAVGGENYSEQKNMGFKGSV